jgi:ABC-type transporter Mla MlaB component
MLRITVEDGCRPMLKLEGRLCGPWVHELERAWSELAHSTPERPIKVDLSGVSTIDSEGKKLLASMLREGADLRAAYLMTKYIVDELRQDGNGSYSQGA